MGPELLHLGPFFLPLFTQRPRRIVLRNSRLQSPPLAPGPVPIGPARSALLPRSRGSVATSVARNRCKPLRLATSKLPENFRNSYWFIADSSPPRRVHTWRGIVAPKQLTCGAPHQRCPQLAVYKPKNLLNHPRRSSAAS